MTDTARPLEPQVVIPLDVRQKASALKLRMDGIARTLTSASVQPAARDRARADLALLSADARDLWRKL